MGFDSCGVVDRADPTIFMLGSRPILALSSEACILRQPHEVNLRSNNDRLQEEPFQYALVREDQTVMISPLWSTLYPVFLTWFLDLVAGSGFMEMIAQSPFHIQRLESITAD